MREKDNSILSGSVHFCVRHLCVASDLVSATAIIVATSSMGAISYSLQAQSLTLDPTLLPEVSPVDIEE